MKLCIIYQITLFCCHVLRILHITAESEASCSDSGAVLTWMHTLAVYLACSCCDNGVVCAADCRTVVRSDHQDHLNEFGAVVLTHECTAKLCTVVWSIAVSTFEHNKKLHFRRVHRIQPLRTDLGADVGTTAEKALLRCQCPQSPITLGKMQPVQGSQAVLGEDIGDRHATVGELLQFGCEFCWIVISSDQNPWKSIWTFVCQLWTSTVRIYSATMISWFQTDRQGDWNNLPFFKDDQTDKSSPRSSEMEEMKLAGFLHSGSVWSI